MFTLFSYNCSLLWCIHCGFASRLVSSREGSVRVFLNLLMILKERLVWLEVGKVWQSSREEKSIFIWRMVQSRMMIRLRNQLALRLYVCNMLKPITVEAVWCQTKQCMLSSELFRDYFKIIVLVLLCMCNTYMDIVPI